MKKIVLLIFLLMIPAVFAAFEIPKLNQNIYTDQKPIINNYAPQVAIDYVKICDQGKTRCYTNSFQVCEKNSWIIKQKCFSDEFCDTIRGCVKKETLLIVKPIIPEPKKIIPTVVVQKPVIPEYTTTLTPKEVILQPKANIKTQELRTSLLMQKKELSLKLEQLKNKISKFKGKEVILSGKKISKKELEDQIRDLEEKLNSIGEDQQLAQIDLQNKMQEMQQLIQTLSNVAESMYDTTMAVVKKSSALTSEESTTSDKKMSKQELNEMIKEVEAQQENIKEKRQEAMNYFQSLDQRANQAANIASTILKSMNEVRNVETTRSMLTSEESQKIKEKKKKAEKESKELLKELEKNSKQLEKDYKQTSDLLNTIKDKQAQSAKIISGTKFTKEEKNAAESAMNNLKGQQKQAEQDKEYYLKKIKEYNNMGEQLSEYLNELNNVSSSKKDIPDKLVATKINKESTVDKNLEILQYLLNNAQQGDLDSLYKALNIITELISKAKSEQNTELAKKLENLQEQSRRFTEDLMRVSSTEDPNMAGKLQRTKEEQTQIAVSQKLISGMMQEMSQTVEATQETTKSALDTQGRIQRTVSRAENSKEEPSLTSKLKNFLGKIFSPSKIEGNVLNESVREETQGPHCFSPAVLAGEGLCLRQQACAQGICGNVSNCVDNEESITVTLENGNTETFNHAESGARYFCRENANSQKYVEYASPCSSPYHTFSGIINYQCTPIGTYCARGSCGAIVSCSQNGNTATITLTNGNTQSFVNYACVGNDLSRISQCKNPFEQQGEYCRTNTFCAESVCGNIATCEKVNSNTVQVTLESGQRQTYSGAYACVRTDGKLLVKKRSECTSPFGQETGFCGQLFRNGAYQNQFCADNVCDFLTSCMQNGNSVTITTANSRSQSYEGYVCDDARGVQSTASSQFSCFSLGVEHEKNSDGAVVDSTLCSMGQACVGNRCGVIATCVDNENSITVTLTNGNTETFNHAESGARYFCRENANGQKYIQYASPCSSPYHTFSGIINYQCTPIGTYCARGNCGAIARCADGNNAATITLTTGDTQTYLWYRCSVDENGNPAIVRRQ